MFEGNKNSKVGNLTMQPGKKTVGGGRREGEERESQKGKKNCVMNKKLIKLKVKIRKGHN